MFIRHWAVIGRQARCYSSRTFSYEEATRWLGKFTQDTIPKDQIQLGFSRSSGPGGQNVNKVNSKADLRLVLNKATWIPEYAREKLKASHRLTKSGEIVFTSDRTRSQASNVQDCYRKLMDTVREAVQVPKDPDAATLARVANLQRVENQRRKERKKMQSQKKSSRKFKGDLY
ncbi:uncharacterized protein BYT42DRAFT_565183 [Radiomyces spectabilis]|uniref:uncharacterized protein n=1 Tax=Radiomyces spectabilis TaxID=64574 RepID=UPI00222041DD|nr:uncharacterized protein BYT42DRAFT_565183 [Radiomyces spectabilis]KAI8381084.1 hypothetical protein BYT42DRAFT_565183 [Radiomyces spectabilis]